MKSAQWQPAAPTNSFLRRRTCACGPDTSSGACAECETGHRAGLQRDAASSAWLGAAPPIVHEVLASPGQPLDVATRAYMEPRLGHDFSRVRVHADAKAAESARAVSALAYTVGRDVVFGAGQFSGESVAGRRLMAHELMHVVQQRDAPATSGEITIGSSEEASELEAREASARLAGSEPVGGSETSRMGRRLSRQFDPRAEPTPSPRVERPRRAGSALSYREATELAECMRIMGSAAYCRQTVLGEPPPPTPLRIERQGGDGLSFISTDTITLTAAGSVVPADWTVQGVSPNAGDGNPHRATNRSQFSFRPNPRRRPTTGSRTPNDPIQYRVEARAGGQTAAFDLTQDETDIIRQEYIDLGPTRPPARSSIVAPTIATYNTGNYSLIVDGGMDNAMTNTEREFQTLTPAGTAAPAIGVSSGYRNPRRNVAAGSEFPVTSRHVWGTALDLTVPGANATLWARLRAAGANAGNTSICENGPTQIPCNNPSVDHVHIHW
jgi:hypothetical protein